MKALFLVIPCTPEIGTGPSHLLLKPFPACWWCFGPLSCLAQRFCVPLLFLRSFLVVLAREIMTGAFLLIWLHEPPDYWGLNKIWVGCSNRQVLVWLFPPSKDFIKGWDPCYRSVGESISYGMRSGRRVLMLLLFPTGSYPEILSSETPTATQVDGADLASPMSPRTSKSRMSMKLRRSSGSANKS